jgi:D-alanyl-lipoteichoic acid acyltransferase DltB (MBOAT superfamily)
VYIPLGGNRQGAWITNCNLMATMVLVGLWHGAAWTFIVWGLYHGILLIGHRLIRLQGDDRESQPWYQRVPSAVLMFHATCIGWVLFRADSLRQAWELLGLIIGNFSVHELRDASLVAILGYIGTLILVQSIQAWRGDWLVLKGTSLPAKGVAYGLLFYLTILHGGTSNSFIYFQF